MFLYMAYGTIAVCALFKILISNCYNAGDVLSRHFEKKPQDNEIVRLPHKYDYETDGGIFGRYSLESKIENAYHLDIYPTNTTDKENSNLKNVRKVTSNELKDKTALTGFDFETVWEYGGADGYDYPILKMLAWR